MVSSETCKDLHKGYNLPLPHYFSFPSSKPLFLFFSFPITQSTYLYQTPPSSAFPFPFPLQQSLSSKTMTKLFAIMPTSKAKRLQGLVGGLSFLL